MTNTADGYDYVIGANVDAGHPHGDLDRIVIDGKIMPLRTGNTGNTDASGNPIPRANIMRGEDIAFLMEFANQRRFAATGGTILEYGSSTTLGAQPRDLSSVRASYFNRKLLPARSNDPTCSFFPYSAFSDLATLSAVAGSSDGPTFHSILFYDELSSASFACPCGTRVPGITELKQLIYEKYGGESFDAAGLTNPDSGGVLLKQTVMYYFDKAAAITDKGVGLLNMNGSTWVSFASADSTASDVQKYRRSVENWDDPSDAGYGDYIPSWGVCEHDFDSGSLYAFHISRHHYGHGYPPGGCNMLTVDAPHGDHAVAICAFVVESRHEATGSGIYDVAVLLRPYAMTREAGTQTFVLKSDDFASASAVDEIVTASGVTFPADTSYVHLKRAGISLYAIPVVYFDDHTRWAAGA